jgi:hypothetical protein
MGGIACENVAENRAHRRKLEALVEQRATRAQIARALGEDYRFSEKGTPSWASLQEFLDRESPNAFAPVRENAQKYSKAMFYSSRWHMTWIFLDDKDLIGAYHIAVQ